MPEQTKEYQVLEQLDHDGKTYCPGEAIKLQLGNADYLLRKKKIGEVDASSTKNKNEIEGKK